MTGGECRHPSWWTQGRWSVLRCIGCGERWTGTMQAAASRVRQVGA